MDDEEYRKLLESAKAQLPEEISKHERFEVPEPDVMVEGKNTIVRNFIDIAESINREPEHILAFLLKELIRNLAGQGKTIFYCSHILEVVEKICNRVIIINEGKIAADGSIDELQNLTRKSSLEDIFSQEEQ